MNQNKAETTLVTITSIEIYTIISIFDHFPKKMMEHLFQLFQMESFTIFQIF